MYLVGRKLRSKALKAVPAGWATSLGVFCSLTRTIVFGLPVQSRRI